MIAQHEGTPMSGWGEAHAAEAQRQRLLLAGLLAPRADAGTLPVRERDERALRGLQAYRANADASAERALATAFPTVQMLLGEEDFQHLAREFWRADPPQRGDLGEWGSCFASWIAAHPQLGDWPYLGDCAALDWALHRCERAEDGTLDAESISRLGDTDPSRLVLRLAPGVALVDSPWPIAAIHAAHRSNDASAFDAVRQGIADQRGESALVSRQGWRGVPLRVDQATAAWTRLLLAGKDLAHAIAQAPDGFDFAAWLALALQSGWVKGIEVLPD